MIRLDCSYSGPLDFDRDTAIIALVETFGGEFDGSGFNFNFNSNTRDLDFFFEDEQQAQDAAGAVTEAWDGITVDVVKEDA